MARLEEVREEWSPAVEFSYIYIKEAHPDDEWQAPKNVTNELIFNQPKTMVDRMDLAKEFVEAMDVKTRTLVDDIANTANACYAGWPERIYVIDKGGIIAYKGGMGPFNFDTDELEEFLADNYAGLREGSEATASQGLAPSLLYPDRPAGLLTR